MKILFSLIALFLSFVGFSQNPTRGALFTVDTTWKPTIKMLAVYTGDNLVYYWNLQSWSSVASGGAGVGSVSGTSNQIASTGGTTPVLSLVSGGTLPGNWILNSSTATTQAAGDNSTKVATTAYVADAVNAAGTFGTIYSKNSWTTGTLASEFTINGATPTIAGTKFTITGGTLTPAPPTSSLDINGYHCLEKWKTYVRFAQGTAKSATTNGVAVGSRSTAANYLTSIYAYVDCSNGADAGKLFISSTVSGTTLEVKTTTTISYTVGDYIDVSLERVGNTFYATARNYTTNTAPISISEVYTTENNGSVPFNLPNTGRFAIWSIGGTCTIDSLNATSNEMLYPNVAVAGDSKLIGYNANWYNSTANLMRSNGIKLVNISGGGNRAEDIYNTKDDIIRTNTKQVIFEAGTNDGNDSINVKLYYQKFIDTMHARGISVILLRPMRDNLSSFSWRLNWFDRTYFNVIPDSCIDTYTPSLLKGYLSSDSLHQSNYGDSLLFNAIMASGKIKGGGNKQDIIIGQHIPDGTGDYLTRNWQGFRTTNTLGKNYFYLAPDGSGTTTYYGDANDANGYARVSWDNASQFAYLRNAANTGLVMTPTLLVTQGLTSGIQTANLELLGSAGAGNSTLVASSDRLTIKGVTGGIGLGLFVDQGYYGAVALPASSLFSFNSTTKGLLIPQMSTANRDAISSPATLLQISNTTQGNNNFYNGVNWAGGLTSSSAGTLTLIHGTDYVFTGTTSTWTLPAPNAAVLGGQNGIKIKNRGSGAITLNSHSGNTLYTTAAANTITIAAGASVELMPDGTYFLVIFNI